jgi:hypothetical protein
LVEEHSNPVTIQHESDIKMTELEISKGFTKGVSISWRSLVRAGGISAILSGICLIVTEGLMTYIYNNLWNTFFVAEISGNQVISVPQQLAFAEANSNFFYGWYGSYFFALLFGLPVILAAYVVLSRVDKGFALIGSSISFAGVGIILANIPLHFQFINEAFTYDGGCTVCASQSITAATATFSAYTADSLGGLVLILGVLILSIVIIKGMLPKWLGIFGTAGSIAVITIDIANNNFYLGILGSLIFPAWLFAFGWCLIRLPLEPAK